jgi:hypothetical protein
MADYPFPGISLTPMLAPPGSAPAAPHRVRVADVQEAQTAAEAVRDLPGLVAYPDLDGGMVWAVQDCFADREVAAHLSACQPGRFRKLLAAKFARLRERDLDYLARTEAEAPWKLDPVAGIGWGDCWRWDGPDLTCFGYVQPLLDVIAGEARCGAGDDEIQYVIGAIRENYSRGWRSGVGYSLVELEGETGYSHVWQLTKIAAAEFAAARSRGWRP